MKKLQNYLMKPEQLRKKLQNPRFRQQFIDWSKNNTSVQRDHSSKQSRSRSPVENIQRSIQLNSKRIPSHLPSHTPSHNKENLRPQSCHRQQLNSSKHTNRPSMTLKMNNPDKMNRSELNNKRNPSSASLNKGSSALKHPDSVTKHPDSAHHKHYDSTHHKHQDSTHKNYDSTHKNYESNSLPKHPDSSSLSKQSDALNNKNRYNSCTSIDYQRRERTASQTAPQQKLKQRYSFRTRQGIQITNPNKVNQDSLVIKSNLADKNINLYAVADGHGTNGHLVSQYLVKNAAKCFENQLKNNHLTDSIPKVFDKLQKGLTDSQINVSCSGSTFVSVFFDNDEIMCANVGDSRAILARQSTMSAIKSIEKVGN